MIPSPHDSSDQLRESIWRRPSVVEWTQRLLDSYRHWTGQDLISRNTDPYEQSHLLFESPFVVVSHGLEKDPILNYGNRAALGLWEMDWEELTHTPSRHTAEPLNRAERARMLARATQRGYIDDYQGVRISKTGNRFLVKGATVWNVLDPNGRKLGQAATFSKWSRIKSKILLPPRHPCA